MLKANESFLHFYHNSFFKVLIIPLIIQTNCYQDDDDEEAAAGEAEEEAVEITMWKVREGDKHVLDRPSETFIHAQFIPGI